MKINTSLELVRYIRHHLAGSEFQDVKAVEDFVEMRLNEFRSKLSLILENETIDYSKHQILREALTQHVIQP